MYKVLYIFTDLQDNNHLYEVGDIYPREGLEPTAERIEELATDKNKQHKPLIEKIVEEPVQEVVAEVAAPKKQRKSKKK